MREWLTVIIVLLIVGIVLDGIRRVRAARSERIQMAKEMPDADGLGDDDISGSEFPSGGARIAGYRHPEDVASIHDNLKSSYANSKRTAGLKPREEPAPVLMDSADSHEPLEPSIGSLDDLDDDVAVVAPVRKVAAERPVVKAQPAAKAESTVKTQAKPQAQNLAPPEEVIVINVMAPEGTYFEGAALLEVLTAQNLRFGDMDIFHRHAEDDGSGEVLFSLANIVKPGTFDLGSMDEFATPGVSLFLMLPLKGDSVAAFGLMARTVKAIASALGGEIKDENRSVMTQQTFEHCRQRVLEFERKRRLKDK